MNIGFLGGRFDPVHLGHLGAVQDALHQHRLDRVIFVPTAQVPHQSQRVHAAVEDRLAMLHLAIAGQLHWEISDFELGRPGASYTVDSVRHFRRLHPAERLFWIIGSDQLAQLHQWRSIRELAVLIEFIVVARPGHPRQPAGEIPALRLHHCNGRLSGTSATELRDRVKHGRPIAHLVPEAVAEYIVRRALYLGGDP